jgi:D-lactate dehydrogenase
MCATACPVLINTGDLVKRLRTDAAAPAAGKAWRFAAGHWNAATRAMAWGLNAASAVPPVVPERVSAAARRVFSAEHVPQWQRDLPRGGKVRRAGPAPDADAAYLPSCLNTMFRPVDSGVGVMNAMLTLADRAGVRLHVPASVSSLCCGTPWSSKGMTSGYHEMGGRVRRALAAATDGGKLPLITDASSCAEGFQDQLESIVVLDASTYVATVLLPRLVVKRRLSSLALHPTCSSTRTGTNETLLAIARQIADEVVVPDEWRCCGFAGDRGMLHPELTASATAPEASALQSRAFDAYASVNRTCEIGMTRATGRPYQHLIELVEQATAPDQR